MLAYMARTGRGQVLTSNQAEQLMQSSLRGVHAPQILREARAAGAKGLAEMAHGNFKIADELLSASVGQHIACLGSDHCAVFLLTAFQQAGFLIAMSNHYGGMFDRKAADERVAQFVLEEEPDSRSMGDCLAACGLALAMCGQQWADQQQVREGWDLIRRAAEVKAIAMGPSHPVTAMCTALSEESLLWEVL